CTAAPSCAAPFNLDLGSAGCIYLHEEKMTFNEARLYCRILGGDLASPAELGPLRQYLLDNKEDDYWVGAMKTKGWFSGRPILEEEWLPEEPNGSGDCVRLAKTHFLVADIRCDAAYKVVCGSIVYH
ncbi:pulmonary surfactant-associated protein D-like, partial [Penaeus japonicus]|uniref:pulmonary surfactant-associated protein D-like n=1 Tax=Penaeus japonicus TaxID=27405 RepID=UPI001C715C29